ncbi:unnamed protein product [Rhizophagus irregularis]|uniref:Uncharacterized protein n=1 Tax=Rhizophagus irregularis TaxID=588596 RepID=A0A2I1HTT8_9GLOM|nr:hypothetical protein RhiirA4_488550 [Rhizophagus irregularis]CAB4402604.1 unnamed protein product [Rhizophagus irregularis]
MSNLLRPIRHIAQNWKLNKLAKKAGVAVAGCRNGVAVQTKAAVVANLVTNGATNYKNKDILFTFRDGGAIELGVKMLMPKDGTS